MKYLIHHGILNQKWGVRHGPPYPLRGGDYSKAELAAIYRRHQSNNSIYNKRHFDEVLEANKTTLKTLSYNPDRTKDTDMFYASHNFWDDNQYNALFNKPIPKDITDADGNVIGVGKCFKYRIENKLSSDMKVASEDSGAEVFRKLYSSDRDFYNFVTDPTRMQDYFVKEKYGFRGYREGKKVLDRMAADESYKPSSSDLQKVYRLFNYVIPYDGAGDTRKGQDVVTQRAKFFKELKDEGYGAVLDTNDAIYGRYKTKSPVIVFDMEKVVPSRVYETKVTDQLFSKGVMVGRKILGQ